MGPTVAGTGPVHEPCDDRDRRRALRAEEVRLAYDDHVIIDSLSLSIPDGKITVIVGPNACGKSTLLRALARLLRPTHRHVILDGEQIHRLPTKEVARRLGLLPADADRPRGHPRRRPRRPRPHAAPEAVPTVVGVRRAGRARRARGDLDDGTRRPAGRRAVRRSAPAGVDRDDARPGDRPAAARRADHVPRHRPPDRRARPVRAAQPRAAAHGRARAPRPQPGVPIRRPHRRRCATA